MRAPRLVSAAGALALGGVVDASHNAHRDGARFEAGRHPQNDAAIPVVYLDGARAGAEARRTVQIARAEFSVPGMGGACWDASFTYTLCCNPPRALQHRRSSAGGYTAAECCDQGRTLDFALAPMPERMLRIPGLGARNATRGSPPRGSPPRVALPRRRAELVVSLPGAKRGVTVAIAIATMLAKVGSEHAVLSRKEGNSGLPEHVRNVSLPRPRFLTFKVNDFCTPDLMDPRATNCAFYPVRKVGFHAAVHGPLHLRELLQSLPQRQLSRAHFAEPRVVLYARDPFAAVISLLRYMIVHPIIEWNAGNIPAAHKWAPTDFAFLTEETHRWVFDRCRLHHLTPHGCDAFDVFRHLRAAEEHDAAARRMMLELAFAMSMRSLSLMAAHIERHLDNADVFFLSVDRPWPSVSACFLRFLGLDTDPAAVAALATLHALPAEPHATRGRFDNSVLARELQEHPVLAPQLLHIRGLLRRAHEAMHERYGCPLDAPPRPARPKAAHPSVRLLHRVCWRAHATLTTRQQCCAGGMVPAWCVPAPPLDLDICCDPTEPVLQETVVSTCVHLTVQRRCQWFGDFDGFAEGLRGCARNVVAGELIRVVSAMVELVVEELRLIS